MDWYSIAVWSSCCFLRFKWGAFVLVGSATLISPLELIRTKLQSQRQSYRELSAVIRSAVHTEGWLTLWRGLGPTLLRDVPFSGKGNAGSLFHLFHWMNEWMHANPTRVYARFSAMYWYNYEKGKTLLCHYNKTSEATFSITFVSGAVSGSVSDFCKTCNSI